MNLIRLIYHTCILAMFLAAPVFGQSSNRQDPGNQSRTIHIQRAERPPNLDDFIAGRIPGNQTPISDFRQQKPADGNPASLPTRAYVSYDDENFYVIFICTAPQGQVRARLSKRDDMFSDDMVAVYLDTFHDRQHALSFYVNPLGIQGDSAVTEGQDEDYNYDIIWKSEARLTADGYAAWIAIPFKSIRFPNADRQTWGFGVARYIPGNNEASYWPYNTTRVEGFTQQLGLLDGIERISPGRNLQVVPYGTFTRLHSLDQPDGGVPSFDTTKDIRAGVDSKVILRDALTLDVTINPDYSQVESEDPQVTTNQRFEVFFPEKRPFFLENANYFQTPENLFFTRRIQDPEYGGRLTGKTGSWLLGILGMDDRSPGNQLAVTDPLFDKHAQIEAVRAQRQIAEQSKAGLMTTYYRFGTNSELVLSGDTRLKFTPNLVLTGQAVHSETHSMSGRSSGSDYFAQLAYSDLHVTANSKYLDRSPFFSSQLGYIPRVDYRQVQQDISYKWLPAARLVKYYGPTFTASRDWNHESQVQDWLVTPGFTAEFAGQTDITISRTQSLEEFQGLPFRKHSTNIAFNTDFWKRVGIWATYSTSARVNYFPGGKLEPFLAAGKDLNLTVTLRPNSRLKVDQIYIFSHLRTLDTGAAILNNHLLRTTVNYQFTRSWSLRAIGDYDAVLPNSNLINLGRDKKLTGDLLLTYMLSPGTALYVGYTDTRENLALISGPPPQVVSTVNPNTATGRQVFVKLSYLFHF
jgi:hypothetical protein